MGDLIAENRKRIDVENAMDAMQFFHVEDWE